MSERASAIMESSPPARAEAISSRRAFRGRCASRYFANSKRREPSVNPERPATAQAGKETARSPLLLTGCLRVLNYRAERLRWWDGEWGHDAVLPVVRA